MTLQGQQFYPCAGPEQRLYPLSFCRECGQEFYGVIKDANKGAWLPRPFDRRSENDTDEAGYLFLAEDSGWSDDPQAVLERVPEDWLELHRGVQRVKKNREQYLPRERLIGLDGTPDPNGVAVFYVPLPFRLCPNCGVSYSGRTGEASKLATLGTGGRSTATTILALATLREMRDSGVVDPERKLLDFTDNRQDASLQAGHFNDFIETTLLRSALCRALATAGSNELRHDQLPAMVFSALAMSKERYLSNPEVRYEALERANRTFRDLLAYRLYVDLRRGWRITAPNLEQIDLLRFEYPSLKELCNCDSDWQRQNEEKRERNPAWRMASPAVRERAATILLDHLRRELAIRVEALDPAHHEILKTNVWGLLRDPWRFEDGEKLAYASVAWVRSRGKNHFDRGGDVYLSPRSGLSLSLKRMLAKESIPFDNPQEVVEDLLQSLAIAGLVERVRDSVNGDAGGWQLNASAMVWKAGAGERSYQDSVRVPKASAIGARPHQFFIDLYRENCAGLESLYAREHTAQVVQEVRQDRERDFREGKLPVLFCSPTMELGVEKASVDFLESSDADLLSALRLIQHGKLTVAGLLLVGNENAIRKHVPGAGWTWVVQRTDTTYENREDGASAIPVAITRLEDLIRPLNPLDTFEQGFFHFEYRRWPELAIREALMNAFCHRDYRQPEPVVVRVQNERLSFENLGGFVGGVRPDNILHHSPATRNALLVSALVSLRLINRLNLGVKRMFTEFLAEGKPAPHISDVGNAVRVDFTGSGFSPAFRAFVADESKQGHALSVDELLTLSYLMHHAEAETVALAGLCQNDEVAQRVSLAAMEKRQYIERGGHGKGTYWTLHPGLRRRLESGVIDEARQRIDWDAAKLQIMSMLTKRKAAGEPGLTNQEMRKITHFDRYQIRRLMYQLRNEGVVKADGVGRAARWMTV